MFSATSIKARASSSPDFVAENVALMFSAGVGYLPPATNGANDICFPYCPAIVCHFVSLNVRDV